jgi:putative ABC transport system substrate-binding protein
VAVIAAPGSTVAALAAKVATDKIPIVFATGTDPVEVGLVVSLNHPAGNVTGVATLNVEVGPKRLEMLHELFPAATSFALLVTNPYQEACRRRLARLGSNSMSCVRAANASSMQCSRPQPDCERPVS